MMNLEITAADVALSQIHDAKKREKNLTQRVRDLEIKLSLLETEVERLRGVAKNIRENPENEGKALYEVRRVEE